MLPRHARAALLIFALAAAPCQARTFQLQEAPADAVAGTDVVEVIDVAAAADAAAAPDIDVAADVDAATAADAGAAAGADAATDVALAAAAAAARAPATGAAAAPRDGGLRRPSDFKAGASTIVDLIDGPRAGARVRCTVLSRGELPETYHIRILSASGASQELRNVPSELLQKRDEAFAAQGFKFPVAPLELPLDRAREERARKEPEEAESAAPELGAELRQEGQRTRQRDELEEVPESVGKDDFKDPKDDSKDDLKDPKDGLKDPKYEEEAQRERIRVLLGKQMPPPAQQAQRKLPSTAELRQMHENERHRSKAQAAERKAASKKRMQALLSERQKQVAEEAAKKEALKAQRKAYWQASKEKLHLTVRDGAGTELQFLAPKNVALRALMITAVERLDLAGATEVRLLHNGTRLDMGQTAGAAGLSDRAVIDLKSRPPARRKAAESASETPEAPVAPAAAPLLKAAKPAVVTPAVVRPAAGAPRGPQEEARSAAKEAQWRDRHERKPTPWAQEPRSARPANAGSSSAEYEVGDFMEIRIEHTVRRLDEVGGNYIPCTITGKGTKPNTYNVHFPLAPSQSQQRDLADVPADHLRMVEAQNWAQKIKRMRQDPVAAQEAVAQAGHEADKRKRLKELTTRLKGSTATAQRAELAEKKPPAQGAAKRPLPPARLKVVKGPGILPRASTLGLGDRHTSLTTRQ